MPIFEYRCETCETTFERLLLRPPTAQQITCPQCGSQRTAKMFSTFSTAAAGHGTAAAAIGKPTFT
jgi:putative FmdB family regulatory protein